MGYFDTVSNDPTLMEISAATHQPSALQDVSKENDETADNESKQQKGSITEKTSFYCNECERSLNDENSYNKHLQSELHFKRSLKQKSIQEGKTPRHNVLPEVHSTPSEASAEHSRKDEEESPISKYQICPTCHSTVDRLKFGKHLISHYHHHMSKSGSKERSDTLILNNIEKIVKECPFQCEICSFFCNWEQDFDFHWKTIHCNDTTFEDPDKDNDMVYWCSLCQVFVPNSIEMSAHLRGDYHKEILSVINRCVPMKIKVNSEFGNE